MGGIVGLLVSFKLMLYLFLMMCVVFRVIVIFILRIWNVFVSVVC